MLIVEMEMPTNCKKCPLVRMDHFGQIRCGGQGGRLIHLKNFQTEIERPSWCPIKGVLPEEHGDLIDRDALKKNGMMYRGGIDEDGLIYVPLRDVTKCISNAPTVIVAERKDDERTDKA